MEEHRIPVSRKLMYPNPPPTICRTIPFPYPLNLDNIIPIAKVNPLVEELGSWTGSIKTRKGTILFAPNCIRLFLKPKNEDDCLHAFIGFMEKAFNFEFVKREFGKEGEEFWIIRKKKSLLKRIDGDIEQFSKDLGFL